MRRCNVTLYIVASEKTFVAVFTSNVVQTINVTGNRRHFVCSKIAKFALKFLFRFFAFLLCSFVVKNFFFIVHFVDVTSEIVACLKSFVTLVTFKIVSSGNVTFDDGAAVGAETAQIAGKPFGRRRRRDLPFVLVLRGCSNRFTWNTNRYLSDGLL
jgi:hypothetical protein